MNFSEIIAQLFKPNGLSSALPNFEYRPSQKKMIEDICQTYRTGEVRIMEAGTGTGKSLSYLIPAALWAKETGETTLISTYTITLQEQILFKDLPIVQKALNLNLKAVIVKGMSNYLCRRRLKEALQENVILNNKKKITELEFISAWSDNTLDGSLTDLDFTPSKHIWERVCCDFDACNKKRCPFYSECSFFKARENAKEAHILITNHALLFSDLIIQKEGENPDATGILPPYNKIIIDEAHNLEETAGSFFASKTSFRQINTLLKKISPARDFGTLTAIKNKLFFIFKTKIPDEIREIIDVMEQNLSSLNAETVDFLNLARFSFADFFQQNENIPREEQKIRVYEKDYQHPDWEIKITNPAQALIEAGKKYLIAIEQLQKKIDDLNMKRVNSLVQGALLDLKSYARRLSEAIEVIANFISRTTLTNRVRWVEIEERDGLSDIKITDAYLDISDLLYETLFNKFSSICLLSATLATNGNFSFIKERLGISKLDASKVKENIYPSPFNYQKQAALFITYDLPNPNRPEFIQKACLSIKTAISAARGGVFVLFTSYNLLNKCFDQLASHLTEHGFTLFKQGDHPRSLLLEKFKKHKYAVLFGTDSFWQGVDVTGEKLKCVIITKLPFQVPTEPMIQARCEFLQEKGLNPFYHYSIPAAVVKFKQGFGRLIRSKTDRGCIVCLDNRLTNASYGKIFIDSVPRCQTVITEEGNFKTLITNFFRHKSTK